MVDGLMLVLHVGGPLGCEDDTRGYSPGLAATATIPATRVAIIPGGELQKLRIVLATRLSSCNETSFQLSHTKAVGTHR